MLVTARITPPNQVRFIHKFDLKKVEYDEKRDILKFRPGQIRYAQSKGINLDEIEVNVSRAKWLEILK